MMESKVHQTLLFLLIFCSISCKSTEDTSDILGFDAPTRSTLEWIDPDDMGMPSTKESPKKQSSLDELLNDFPSQDEIKELMLLKEEINVLNSKIGFLEQENTKLNHSNMALQEKCTYRDNLSNNSSTNARGGPKSGALMTTQNAVNGVETFLLRHARLLSRKLQTNTKDLDHLEWKEKSSRSNRKNRVLRFTAKLELSENDAKILQTLSSNCVTNVSMLLYDLDHILSNYITDVHAEPKEMNGNTSYVTYLVAYLSMDHNIKWVLSIIAIVFVSLSLYSGKLHPWRFLISMFFVSTIWHWTRMYKMALVEKHTTLSKAKSIPNECSPELIPWSNFVLDKVFTRSDKCKEYYEALMIDPLLEVTPTMALAETFTAFVVQPMEHLGRHIGKFFNALLQETSWLSSPVILSFVFIAILLCMVMLFGYRFRLPFFLGSFEPRNNLSDSFAIERKEQQKMIVELKTTLDSLKVVHTPSQRTSALLFQTSTTESESIAYENRISDADTVDHEISESHETNLLQSNRKLKKRYEHISHKRSSSSPSKLCPNGNKEARSLQCDLKASDSEGSINAYEDESLSHSFENDDLSEISLSTKREDSSENNRIYQLTPVKELAVKEIDKTLNGSDSEYQLTPVKELAVKETDKDPTGTDFEWVTELLDNKFDEIEHETTEPMNESCENKELNPEETKFIDKAKDIFQDVLYS